MIEPAGVKWTADSFEMELRTYSIASALMGVAVFLAGLVLAILGAAIAIQTDPELVWLLPVLMLVAFGVTAVLAQRAEQQLAKTTIYVDSLHVLCDGQKAPFHRVRGIEWQGTRLELHLPDGVMRIETPRMRPEERDWLESKVRSRWEALKARRGEVPAALSELRLPESS